MPVRKSDVLSSINYTVYYTVILDNTSNIQLNQHIADYLTIIHRLKTRTRYTRAFAGKDGKQNRLHHKSELYFWLDKRQVCRTSYIVAKMRTKIASSLSRVSNF